MNGSDLRVPNPERWNNYCPEPCPTSSMGLELHHSPVVGKPYPGVASGLPVIHPEECSQSESLALSG